MSHQTPENLKYTKEHEWAKYEEGILTVGITDFAQSSLGDIVYVELPEAGDSIEFGGAFGVVESIKSVSDLYSPVSGEIVEVNKDLEATPELCNQNPYDSWMIKVKVNSQEEVDKLLSHNDYQEHCTNH